MTDHRFPEPGVDTRFQDGIDYEYGAGGGGPAPAFDWDAERATCHEIYPTMSIQGSDSDVTALVTDGGLVIPKVGVSPITREAGGFRIPAGSHFETSALSANTYGAVMLFIHVTPTLAASSTATFYPLSMTGSGAELLSLRMKNGYLTTDTGTDTIRRQLVAADIQPNVTLAVGVTMDNRLDPAVETLRSETWMDGDLYIGQTAATNLTPSLLRIGDNFEGLISGGLIKLLDPVSTDDLRLPGTTGRAICDKLHELYG